VSDLENHRVQVYTFVGGSPVYSTTIGVTGVSGNDNAHFNWPARIVIDSSDRLYVADVENFRVQRCTYAAGWTCANFHGTGSEGSGANELSWASGLGIDSSDNIYIADGGNSRVKQCTSGGICSTFASGFDWPADVAVDSSGNVYVSDFFECTVRKYNSSGGSQGIFAGTSGVPYLTDNSHFNTPYGVAVDGSGNIYLSTRRGYRVLKLNASGTAQWAAGVAGVWGNDNVHFGADWSGPNDVAVDSSGNVYVADTGNHRIQIYNSSGSYVTTLGSYGSGYYQFHDPYGVAVDHNGNIYVVDEENHRVQIFNSSRVYQATLGVTDVPGDDNAHFNKPRGVAVDASDNIYVADTDNNRVQVFNSSRVYQRTIGSGGSCNDAFDRFCGPHDVAVDAQSRIYVADAWNNRVQVFDGSGAYLTTIGGAWGDGSGQLRGAMAVDVDSSGNVYVADENNARIQKFAPGVPDWEQVNINGFGHPSNPGVLSLASFKDYLYAGVDTRSGDNNRLWRKSDGEPWTAVITESFGLLYNHGIDHLIEFNDQLYASTRNWNWNVWETEGGEIWRSSNGLSWTRIISQGFGDSTNGEVFHFAVFNDTLYASTWSYTDTHGTEIWRSSTGNAGDWARVVTNGFDGDTDNQCATTLEVFNGYLYAGTFNWDTGGEIWRTPDGTNWTQVNSDGFGDYDNDAIASFAVFNGYLYGGTMHDSTGGQVWRCSTVSGCDEASDWEQVVSDGFGSTDNRSAAALVAFDNYLYCVTENYETGAEVWRSSTGDSGDWEQVGPDGFGDSNNESTNWDNSVAVFNDRLYIGTWNWANGGEVWQLAGGGQVYLPIILKSFSP
jgi:DNA-binding beta-propeller fold protein YncE